FNSERSFAARAEPNAFSKRPCDFCQSCIVSSNFATPAGVRTTRLIRRSFSSTRHADSFTRRFHARPSRQATPGQYISNQPNVRSRCKWLACRFDPADREHPTQIARERRASSRWLAAIAESRNLAAGAAHPAFPAPSPNEGHYLVKARAHSRPESGICCGISALCPGRLRATLPPARAVVYERFATGTC